jgi:membrane protease YdiL (CAAX protease family)
MALDGVFPLSSTTASRRIGRAYLELFLGWTMLEAALWSLGNAQLLLGVGALAIMVGFNYESGVTSFEQGFSLRAVRRALWIIPATLALAGAMLTAGALAGTLHPLYGLRAPLRHALGYATWAFVQEWMALGFVLVRFERMVTGRYAVLGCAVIFGLAHAPNLVLMATTFVMASAFALLFRRYRSLYPLAVAHALLGMSLALSAPPPALHFMRVGAGYFR